MKTPRFAPLIWLTALAAALTACSKGDTPPTPAAAPAATAAAAPANLEAVYARVAAEAKGFTVGQMMSAQTVYVLFDPQCPHCGHLWQAAQPLWDRAKFVWIPIAFNQGKSLNQAVALLAAGDPATAMTEHEKALLAGQGGMTTMGTPDPALVQAVQRNTELLNALGADAVPFILAKHRSSGALIAQSGARPTADLAALLGIQ